MGLGGIIFDFIGAVVRWVYGTIWRSIARKKKFTFQEYLHGPNNSDGWFDLAGHSFNNRIIGAVVLVALCSLFV
jgi:hypothetical protein